MRIDTDDVGEFGGRVPLTREVLEERYVLGGEPVRDIARDTGYSIDAVRDNLRRHGLYDDPRRPSEHPALTRVRTMSRAELESLHHKQGLTLQKMAALLDTHPREVRRRMQEVGVSIRRYHASTGAPLPPGGERRLRALYGREDVRRILRRHRVPRRDRSASTKAHEVVLGTRLVRELYVDLGLSASEIGLLTARSPQAVVRALRRSDVTLRPPPPPNPRRWRRVGPPRPRPAPITKQALLDLYVRDNLTLKQVAEACGYRSALTVRRALERFDIPVRRQTVKARSVELTRALLEELYVRQGMSGPQIVAALGEYSNTTVLAALHHFGIATRAPPPRPTPEVELSAEVLRELYVVQRFRAREIAERLGYPRKAVTDALRRHGIEVEDRRGRPRAHRVEFDREQLEDLYVRQELSGEAIGELLGYTPTVIRRRLHDYGIPVRRNRWQRPSEARPRVARLHGDRRVRTALVRSEIPFWHGSKLPMREEALPSALLQELYVRLDLSAFDIELLTGRLEASVIADLRQYGIPIRPATGGRRRTRAAS